mmetsp:Transcript_6873/g.12126  ORF Transcript_6873/g.12126 Transcript_6873/m.12126 type:complete len:324 (-) Transcript_6873:42-1013(-)
MVGKALVGSPSLPLMPQWHQLTFQAFLLALLVPHVNSHITKQRGVPVADVVTSVVFVAPTHDVPIWPRLEMLEPLHLWLQSFLEQRPRLRASAAACADQAKQTAQQTQAVVSQLVDVKEFNKQTPLLTKVAVVAAPIEIAGLWALTSLARRQYLALAPPAMPATESPSPAENIPGAQSEQQRKGGSSDLGLGAYQAQFRTYVKAIQADPWRAATILPFVFGTFVLLGGACSCHNRSRRRNRGWLEQQDTHALASDILVLNPGTQVFRMNRESFEFAQPRGLEWQRGVLGGSGDHLNVWDGGNGRALGGKELSPRLTSPYPPNL